MRLPRYPLATLVCAFRGHRRAGTPLLEFVFCSRWLLVYLFWAYFGGPVLRQPAPVRVRTRTSVHALPTVRPTPTADCQRRSARPVQKAPVMHRHMFRVNTWVNFLNAWHMVCDCEIGCWLEDTSGRRRSRR